MLGVAEKAIATVDPVSFGRALFAAGRGLVRHPVDAGAALGRAASGAASAWWASVGRMVGKKSAGPATAPAGDRRFADPAFEDNPYFFWLAQAHLLAERCVSELLDAAALTGAQDDKARFAAKFLLDAAAPTNTLLGNPQALRTAFDTGGRSLVRGLGNWLGDVRDNGGWPRQVDATGFELGVNMAATPGKVVHRSALIEVLQYRPQTAEVHEVPLLFCPPWINKYYILDLAPGKSLIEWAVRRGHTCFTISYRNPDASMRDVSFEDYLMQGPLAAIEVVKAITGADQVNTVSVCLGGTLSAIGLAYEAREGRRSVRSATFLNTNTDFEAKGLLGAFADPSTFAALERRMNRRGYLEARDMARTFDVLRANDLIFSYLVNNWLLGKRPPAFDMLAWNNDSTRMPARMHARYLRSCVLDNDFAGGRFTVGGAPVDPGAANVDTYVLSAVQDHIVPWRSAYRTTRILGGRHRFVLSGGGHIAGIVNPPRPKAEHWTNEASEADPDRWLAGATRREGTWWEDWSRWLAERAGARVAAPTELGSAAHPPMEDAPGTYVFARA